MNRKWLRRAAAAIILTCAGLASCNSGTSSTESAPTAYAVLRLTASGVPDTGFGGGRGIVTTEIDPNQFDFAQAVAIQPDNKILVGGSSGLAGQGIIALARYDQTGALDTAGFGTSGTGGIVRTPTPTGWTAASATAIAVQTDNKIVVAALAVDATGNTGIVLLRYNPDGTLDKTGFGASNGFVTATIGPGSVTDTCAVALQGTNIIVAGGSSDGNVVLYRYLTTGLVDATFGNSGKASTLIGPPARSPAIAFQSGKIIVATGTSTDQVVLRYSADGLLDPTFGDVGTPGKVVTDINGAVNYANAVAVQSNGKIVVAGHANLTDSTSDISLVRYTVDGALDTSFNASGVVTTDLKGRFDNALSIALQTQDPAEPLIVLSGNAGFNGFSQIAVLRYDNDGSPDITFGPTGEGVVLVNPVGPSNVASGNAVALQAITGGVGIVVAGFD
jgi:uncharacterized delta-60 repeat protein